MAEQQSAKGEGLQWGRLVAALATVGVCDIAFGLTFQLQPLILHSQGLPAWLIGAISAMGPLGIFLGGPFLPHVVERFGGKRVVLLAVIAIAVLLLAMALLPPLYWWFGLRLALGLSIGTLFTVSESWMLTLATDQNRGRIMGVYTAVLSITFAVGPMILPFTGIHGFLPWGICIAMVLLGLLPLLLLDVGNTAQEGGKGSVWNVLRQAPLLFACIGAATVFDSVFVSFFSIFAVQHGVPLATASTMLGAGLITGVVLFYPLGLWADWWSRSAVIILCALATIASCMVLPLAITLWWAWPLTMLLTTAAFGVYVVALALMGDIFKGKDVVAGSAATAAMWGAGGIVGPPLAGRLIDSFGINAFAFTLAGFYALLLAGIAANGGRVARTQVPA